MHIHHDTNRRVHPCQLLDAHNRRGEVHAGAAVLLGDLDAHEALLEALLDDGRVHGLGLVHGPRLGQHRVARELAHLLRHERLRLRQVRDGCRRHVG